MWVKYVKNDILPIKLKAFVSSIKDTIDLLQPRIDGKTRKETPNEKPKTTVD